MTYNVLIPLHIFKHVLPADLTQRHLNEDDVWLFDNLRSDSELKQYLEGLLQVEGISLRKWNRKWVISTWYNNLKSSEPLIKAVLDEYKIGNSVVAKRLNDTDELILVYLLDDAHLHLEDYNLIQAISVKHQTKYNY